MSHTPTYSGVPWFTRVAEKAENDDNSKTKEEHYRDVILSSVRVAQGHPHRRQD